MKNLKQLIIIATIILVIFYPFFILFSPIKIEIVPTNKQIQAHIYKSTMLNPFNDIFIQNVKKAVITESKDSKGISRYRVEIEDFQGNRFPVTSYEASGYNSEISIEAKINNSIKNKTHFKYTISSHYLTMLMIFLVLTFYRLPKRLYYKLRYEDS